MRGSSSSPRDPVVSPERLRGGDVRLIDVRSGGAGRDRFRRVHLRGAVRADLETDLSAPGTDPAEGGRHPLPALADFAQTLARWGVRSTTTVVAYDELGGAHAARLWWMLRSAGHRLVFLLDGGLPAALAASVPPEYGAERSPHKVAPYPATEWRWPLVGAEEVRRCASSAEWKVLDVRSAARFRGEVEPIDPVAGHIPGAANLPFEENLGAGGRFLPPEELREKYTRLLGGRSPERLIVHCGSGVTACHTLAALHSAGLEGARLYVGSWGEWCRRAELPRASEVRIVAP